MRSFTLNHPNLKSIIYDKRVDDVIKKLIVEHQHALSINEKEMQSLRDELQLSINKFESISKYYETELQDFKEHAFSHINILKEQMKSNYETIRDQKKVMDDLYNRLNDLNTIYATKGYVDNSNKELDSSCRDSIASNIKYMQADNEILTHLHKSLKSDFISFKNESNVNLIALEAIIANNFSVARLDKEGVLKTIKIYEKDVFIIEKKIENLYTLIDRINQKGSQ